jgi:DNA modification methylase
LHYIEHLVPIFREVRRVLRPDGTLFLNMGDAYWNESPIRARSGEAFEKTYTGGKIREGRRRRVTGHPTLKKKDLIGFPWMLAFALRDDGWWLRGDMPWAKGAGMPESVEDRFTRNHEYVFMLAKSPNYFFDHVAVREPSVVSGHTRRGRSVWNINPVPYAGSHFATFPPELPRRAILAGTSEKGSCARCGAPWWRILKEQRVLPIDYDGKWKATDPQSSGRRFLGNMRARRVAGGHPDNPFPEPITLGWEPTCNCGCQETVPCVVLDPFCGSGTTLMVATDLGRDFVGFEINPGYRSLIEDRVGPALRRARERRLFDEMMAMLAAE